MSNTVVTASPVAVNDAWVHTAGQAPGDYLIGSTVPGVAWHVVTLTQDATGAQYAACTCSLDRFDTPIAMLTLTTADGRGPCSHVQTVWNFLYIRPDVYTEWVAARERVVARLERIGAPAALLAQHRTALAVARENLRHRLAATVAPCGQTEAASAASLPLVSRADAYAAEWATDDTAPLQHSYPGCYCDDGSCWAEQFAYEAAGRVA